RLGDEGAGQRTCAAAQGRAGDRLGKRRLPVQHAVGIDVDERRGPYQRRLARVGGQVVVQVIEDGSRDRDRRQRAVFERLQPEARGGLGAALISLRGFQGRTTAYEGRQYESPRALRVHGPILLGKGIG